MRGTPVFRAPPVSPGENTHFPCTWCLARGKHPHSAHLSLARSQHPRQPQGFGSLPTSRPGLGKTPYTTVDVFPVVSVPFYPMYPARAGFPFWLRGSTSTLRTRYECGMRLTNHFISTIGRMSSVYSTDFHPFRITLYLSNPITIYQDKWVSGYSPDDSHNIALSQNNNTSAPFKNTRETDCFSVSPQGSPPVRRESPATRRGRYCNLDPP